MIAGKMGMTSIRVDNSKFTNSPWKQRNFNVRKAIDLLYPYSQIYPV